ncbi:MAG: hypothetical protein C0592_05345 [Marinilabiliales bacterium]|nr:MAG: hypothetical protein C0592_05345 [Marinilabiliales bacterium]
MEPSKYFPIFILSFLIFSCSSKSQLQDLEKAKRSFREYSTHKEICDHFPNEVYKNKVISYFFAPPGPSNPQFGELHLILKMDEDEIKTIKSGKYLFSGPVDSDQLWVVTLDQIEYYSCEDSVDYENLTPIADLSNVDFGFGSYTDSVYFGDIDEYAPVDQYYLPPDMEVFVIDAKAGFFWEIEEVPERYRRCDNLQSWKNGYSYGYAISEENNYVTYWVVAW